jgi:hypothetical protein
MYKCGTFMSNKGLIPRNILKNVEGACRLEWYMKCLKNYANFKGRARRAEY